MNKCVFSITGLIFVERDKLSTGYLLASSGPKQGPDEARSNLSKACLSQQKSVLLLRKHIYSYENRRRNLHLHAYKWLKPDHDMLAISSLTYLALDSKQLPNCKKFSTTYCCENLFLVTHRSEHTCESVIYCNKSASLINEKCNFGYYHELTPEPRVLDAGDYLLLAGLRIPWTFFCIKRKTNSKTHRR